MKLPNRRPHRIARKLQISIVTFSVLITVIIAFGQLFFDYHRDIRALEENTASIKRSYLQSLSASLWILDQKQVTLQLQGIFRLKHVVYASVESGGKIFFFGTVGGPSEKSVEFPIEFDSDGVIKDLGKLKITYSLQPIKERLFEKFISILTWEAAKNLALSLFVISAFQRLVGRHIVTIAAYIRKIHPNNLEGHLRISRQSNGMHEDELDIFVQEINSSQAQLRLSYEALLEQKEFLKVVIYSIGDALIATGREGIIEYANPLSETILEKRAGELNGEALIQIFPPLLSKVYESNTAKHIINKQGINVRFLSYSPHPDEHPKILEYTIEEIKCSKGIVFGTVVVFRDVTQRIKIEKEREFFSEVSQAFVASSLSYESTLHRLSELIVPTLGDICSVDLFSENGEAKRLCVKVADPAKQNIADRMEKEPSMWRPDSALLRAIGSDKPLLFQKISSKDLEGFSATPTHLKGLAELNLTSAMAVPLLSQGKILGVVSLGLCGSKPPYDRSDLLLLEDFCRRAALAIDNAFLHSKTEKLYAESQTLHRAKDEFLATLSHELRTPLTAILGWTNLMGTGNLTENQHAKAIEVIQRSAQTQARLIDDMLDTSSIVTGKTEMEWTKVNMTSLLRMLLDSVYPTILAKNIPLTDCLSKDPLFVRGDQNRLQQVVWNLLTNALKFTPNGGWIQVTSSCSAGTFLLTIADSGKGISREFLPFVFDRFKQEDSSITRKHGGLGLGLAIAQHLILLHGGSISVKSEGHCKGAEFRISVPLYIEKNNQE